MSDRKSTGLTLKYIGEPLGFGTEEKYKSLIATAKTALIKKFSTPKPNSKPIKLQ